MNLSRGWLEYRRRRARPVDEIIEEVRRALREPNRRTQLAQLTAQLHYAGHKKRLKSPEGLALWAAIVDEAHALVKRSQDPVVRQDGGYIEMEADLRRVWPTDAAVEARVEEYRRLLRGS